MFSIGEFSRIACVTPRQLRHYEELGLFKPERIDPETGYRSYSALQLPRLNRILALKELGLTLTQILRLLDENISAQEIRGMLTMRKAQIEQTLRDELERVRSIEARIFQVEEQAGLSTTWSSRRCQRATFFPFVKSSPQKRRASRSWPRCTALCRNELGEVSSASLPSSFPRTASRRRTSM